MKTIHFIQDFHFHHDHNWNRTTVYPAGYMADVDEEVALLAVDAGAAVYVAEDADHAQAIAQEAEAE